MNECIRKKHMNVFKFSQNPKLYGFKMTCTKKKITIVTTPLFPPNPGDEVREGFREGIRIFGPQNPLFPLPPMYGVTKLLLPRPRDGKAEDNLGMELLLHFRLVLSPLLAVEWREQHDRNLEVAATSMNLVLFAYREN